MIGYSKEEKRVELDLARKAEAKALADFESGIILYSDYKVYCDETDRLQREYDNIN